MTPLFTPKGTLENEHEKSYEINDAYQKSAEQVLF